MKAMRDTAGPGRSRTDLANAGILRLDYDRCDDRLFVTVSAPAPSGRPERDELGWATLRALVGELRVQVRTDVATVTLVEPIPSAGRVPSRPAGPRVCHAPTRSRRTLIRSGGPERPRP